MIKLRHLFNKTRLKLNKWFTPLVWAVICSVILLIFSGFSHLISSLSPYHLTLKVWNSDTKSAVVSYYFDPKLSISTSVLDTLILRADNALGGAGASKLSKTPGSKILSGSYAAFLETGISNGSSTIAATAIKAGGDFFMIHPLKLISGAYPDLSRTDMAQILLDEALAWQIFGSTDIIGKQVIIAGQTYSVSGIFQKDNSKLNKLAGMPEKLFIMPFSQTSRQNSGSAQADPGAAEIAPAMFEVLAQNPVKDFTQTALKSIITGTIAAEDKLYIKEYPLRFSYFEAIKTIGKFPLIAMNHIAYKLPYWENAQRGLELFSSLCALFQSIALLYIMVFVLTALFKSLLYLRFNFKKVFKGIVSGLSICYNRIRKNMGNVINKKAKVKESTHDR